MIDSPVARIKRVVGLLVRWLEQSRAGGALMAGFRAAARSVGWRGWELFPWCENTGVTRPAMPLDTRLGRGG